MTSLGDQDWTVATSQSRNMTAEDYLSILQYDSNLRNTPKFIYFFVLEIVGLIGNSLILIVYSRKKRETATVVFIKSIAVVDLITNVVIIPATTYVNYNAWNFLLPSLCKAYIYLITVMAVTPTIIILAIAVTRYRKICHPFGWQVSTQQARVFIIMVAILSCLYCIPYTIVHGLQTVPTPEHGINVTVCNIEDDYVTTIWPSMTNGSLILTFFLCCVPVTILYVLIGKRAWRHRHTASSLSKRKNSSVVESHSGKNLERVDLSYTSRSTESKMLDNEEREESTQQTNKSTLPIDKSTKQPEESTQKCCKISDKMISHDVDFKAKTAVPLSPDSTPKVPRVSIKIKPKSESQKNVGRITRMLFVLSAVYVLSNLTTLVLLLISAALHTTFATFSPVPDAIIRLFIKSYLINCAVNPIIYNFYDRDVRKECYRMLRLSRK